MLILSFFFFLTIFAVIGLASVMHRKNHKHDYFVASGSVSPALVALSAVATNNSGYMFIGVIGYTYSSGMAAVWLMIGWLIGDFLASLFAYRRISEVSTQHKHVTFSGLLANWTEATHSNKNLQRLFAVLSLFFLITYAAAQLVAGSKALSVLLDWPNAIGALLGAILVLLYCYAGGIRASIWTDAAQSVVMICAMLILLTVATISLGGPGEIVSQLEAIPGYIDAYPDNLLLPGVSGLFLFILGWAFGGLSVMGQPQVMIRFMTLNDSNCMTKVRVWYYSWFVAFYFMATGVGLLARLYFEGGSFDPELALPMMAKDLLPSWLVGLTLAAIFAATISTTDSLILSCSSALSQDLMPGKVQDMRLIKLGTVVVLGIALGLALLNNQSVFKLVIFSWSALASAFAPLLIARCLNWQLSNAATIAGTLVGLAAMMTWHQLGLNSYLYEGMPGILAGLAVLAVAHRFAKRTGDQATTTS